mgnify:CR=1 FL=1
MAVTVKQQSRLEGVNRYSNRRDSAMTLRGIRGKVWFRDADEEAIQAAFAGSYCMWGRIRASGLGSMRCGPESYEVWLTRKSMDTRKVARLFGRCLRFKPFVAAMRIRGISAWHLPRSRLCFWVSLPESLRGLLDRRLARQA